VDWFNFIRDVCAEDLRRNPVRLGGIGQEGQPRTVEVDESCFFKRKYHRGALRYVFAINSQNVLYCTYCTYKMNKGLQYHAIANYSGKMGGGGTGDGSGKQCI